MQLLNARCLTNFKFIRVGVFRKMSAHKVTSVILLGWFYYGRFVGLLFYRLNKSIEGLLEIEETSYISCWWKRIITVICHLLPICFHVYNIFVTSVGDPLNLIMHWTQHILHILCYFGLACLERFRSPKVIKLVNRFFKLHRRVADLQEGPELGSDNTEFLLTLLTVCCMIHEIVSCLYLLTIDIDRAVHNYIFIVSHIVLRINFFWYISVSILYLKINEYMLTFPQRTIQDLELALTLHEELSILNGRFQTIFNSWLFWSMLNETLFIVNFLNDILMKPNSVNLFHISLLFQSIRWIFAYYCVHS